MIYIFKTNIKSNQQIKKLKLQIDSDFPNTKWNFDLEDCDKIFRIESEEAILDDVCKTFHLLGYNCEELQD